MSPESKDLLQENNFLFDYIISEKEKYFKKAISIKMTVFLLGSLFIILRLFPEYLKDSFALACISCGVLIVMLAIPLLLMKNGTILSPKAKRLFYYTYKIQLVGNIIKLISENLKYKPQNRILNNIIIQSGLFGDKITEFKGRNLIFGEFGDTEIQLSELTLWKGMHCLFKGLFVYVSKIDNNKVDLEMIKNLNCKWVIRNTKLYMAFEDINKLFEVRIERSNRSIDKIRHQLDYIIDILQVASKAANITFNSFYKVENLNTKSGEILNSRNTFLTKENIAIAPTEKRMLNLFLDQFAIVIIWFVLVFLVSNLYRPLLKSELILLSMYFLVILIYYVIAESVFSITLGKFVTKTIVITTDGRKPNLRTILIRTLCRFIPYEAYSFINKDIGLHDKYSKTIVIIDK